MNDILVVGIPKSGTNALEKTCKLLGLNPTAHLHTANSKLALTNKVGYIYRNPRNVLISALRYRNHQRRGWNDDITEDKLIDCFYDFFNVSLDAMYRSYASWLESSACIVRFEDLISGDTELRKLCLYMGIDMPDVSYTQILGGTYTWTGELSQWDKFWTPALEEIWEESGMVEIEKGLGYGKS